MYRAALRHTVVVCNFALKFIERHGMKNDPLCIKEDVCDMAVCDGVSSCSHAVLKTAVLAQQTINNLKAEIAALVNELNTGINNTPAINLVCLVLNKLRQLSAV